MELDNLKALWQDIGQKDISKNSDEQIARMLQKKSQSPIAKMKRNLFWELITVIVLYSITISYFFATSKGRYWELAVMLLVVAIAFILYYQRKNKLLHEMQCITCEVRSNLQKQLATLEKYVRFYLLSGIILAPIAYFVTGMIVLFNSPLQYINTGSMEFIIFIIIGLAITVASYFFNKWYIKKLYGQHIIKLKELLLQMEEAEIE
jgi:hypothetical protein